MSSGPEGEQMPSRRGRIDDGICSDSCVIQEPLDVEGGSIYDMLVEWHIGHDPQRRALWLRAKFTGTSPKALMSPHGDGMLCHVLW
jgi:hypothetical protein